MSPLPAQVVITDITVVFGHQTDALSNSDSAQWSRIDKDLYLRGGGTRAAWLWMQWKKEEALTDDDKVLVHIGVDDTEHSVDGERRPGGVRILRKTKQETGIASCVTNIDVLFGSDAVDPRPGWTLSTKPLQLEGAPEQPLPRLTARHGHIQTNPDVQLKLSEDGRFKILQISDLHFGTGPGFCNDAIDVHGNSLPPFEADPMSVKFVGQMLDSEKPDLAVLAGDSSEFGKTPDTQTAILKYTAPLIERCIPFAIIFGNHDDEGPPSLSRASQMELFQGLPYCVALPGPEEIDGVGNYCLAINDSLPITNRTRLVLFFLDSHNRLPGDAEVYDWIKQSQIDWFKKTSRHLKHRNMSAAHRHDPLSLAFIHIPVPEYREEGLFMTGGRKREEVMSPEVNSHFYDALVEHEVQVLSCGHDHVNDYCALRPQRQGPRSNFGPWLCYGGGSGFGGYGGYGGYHRRVRIFEADVKAKRIVTWKRVEYQQEKVDELVLVESGTVVSPE